MIKGLVRDPIANDCQSEDPESALLLTMLCCWRGFEFSKCFNYLIGRRHNDGKESIKINFPT